jgi:ABC-2 type transport system ATP-binding protein
LGKGTAIEVGRIFKKYDNGFMALRGADLSVQRGEIFAVLGPNGAGKTTLMRILTTQIRPTSGSAKVFGLSVTERQLEIREGFGYVPQEMSVWTDISGRENLIIYSKIYGVPAAARRKIIDEVLGAMDLLGVADRLVKTYSGGMIRRLELACAFLTKPKILFLDEPTIGLDPSAREKVWEMILSFKKEMGTTILFNTHYMSEADRYSDRIGIMAAGKVILTSDAEKLKKSLGEVVLLEFSGFPASKALSAVKGISHAVIDGKAVKVFCSDAEKTAPKLIEALRKAGATVTKVSIDKPSLDDVFLKYAGKGSESGRASEVAGMRQRIRRGG